MMKRLTLLLWVAGLFILGLSSLHAQTGGPFLPSAADNRCRQWVDSVLSGLNVHEKVGQLIVATIPARADKATKKQMRELVKKYKVGGLLFSEGTPEEQAILTNMARKDAKIPVMVTFDGEWGLSMRLKGVPDYPRNAALGCIEDNGLIEEYGREVARQFRELGVHVNFAPDADVNTNPLNPVIHVRSFGENPQRVAEKVVAYFPFASISLGMAIRMWILIRRFLPCTTTVHAWTVWSFIPSRKWYVPDWGVSW